MNEIIADFLAKGIVQFLTSLFIYWAAYKIVIRLQTKSYKRGVRQGIRIYQKALLDLSINLDIIQTMQGESREIKVHFPKTNKKNNHTVVEVSENGQT